MHSINKKQSVLELPNYNRREAPYLCSLQHAFLIAQTPLVLASCDKSLSPPGLEVLAAL